MNFGMIILNQSISKMQNYATWIKMAIINMNNKFILKLKMFMKILQIMLKIDLIHQIMKSTDHCLQKIIKR